ncbi:FtsK/SpoIIIE domain-containing protein [Oceanobacillus oncorhynchi subsp. oncorhynchi]|uniref:FtsK/SpoIIIE domain-containing protein n=1 Tax=Oceanobacillus oncorhynchi TaxID=545501 RepID=UPI0031E4663A
MEVFIGAGLAALSIYASSNWNKSDRKKIAHTFVNIGYKVGDNHPKLIKAHRTDSYTTYTYNVPYGLIDDPKLQVIEKVLNRPIKISFTNQKLHIKVYRHNLKQTYPYSMFPSKGSWTIPIGMSQEGVVYHDFDTIPHMTVSGATTWGKTVFMRMMLAHLIENNPDGVEFYILDLKGKLAFNKYRNLKQVKIVAGDFRECYHALSMVRKDIKNDMNYLLSIDAENAKEGNIQTRKFIIVDEAGELVPNSDMSDNEKYYTKECQRILSHIARVAGQIGYKLIFGTQYPTKEILSPQIKANALAKVSFRLSTTVQSGVALDQPGAEKLICPGRAIYKTVDEHVLQTPFISKDEIWERVGMYNDDSTDKEATKRRTNYVEFG